MNVLNDSMVGTDRPEGKGAPEKKTTAAEYSVGWPRPIRIKRCGDAQARRPEEGWVSLNIETEGSRFTVACHRDRLLGCALAGPRINKKEEGERWLALSGLWYGARVGRYGLARSATELLGLMSFMTSRTAVSSWRSRPARLSSGVFST
jgi:hypothetical protein